MHSFTLGGEFHAFKEGLNRHINELLSFGADGTTGKGCCTIAMKTLIERAHIHRHDIPFLQDITIRNSVDHSAVDADTRACREAVVAEERRFRALSHNVIVNGLIDCLRRYAGLYHLTCKSAGSCGDLTGLTHGLQLTFIFDRDHTLAPIALRISSLAPSIDWLPLTCTSLPSFS